MPTQTFSIASSTDDNYIYQYDPTTYPPPGNQGTGPVDVISAASRKFDGTNYMVIVALLRWDTSGLPDGVLISSASLRVYVTALTNADSRSLAADYYDWYGTSGELVSSSYTATPPTPGASTTALSGTALSTFTAGQVNTIPLEQVTNINTTGFTNIRLHITGVVPTGVNQMDFASFNNSSGFQIPQLVVDYGATTRLAPDAILAQTNLTGAVSTIQDDPDSPDANWLTAP